MYDREALKTRLAKDRNYPGGGQIHIHILRNGGCIVTAGCKEICFEDAMDVVQALKDFIENPNSLFLFPEPDERGGVATALRG